MKRSQMIGQTCGILAVLYLVGTAGFAGESDTTSIDPKADALLLRHVEALGGKTILQAITTQRLTGSIERHGNKVPHVRTQKGPNLLLVETRFPRPGTLKQGFNGTIGWVQHPIQGGRRLEGKELAEFADQAWLYPALHLHEMYPVRKWLGTRTLEETKLTALSLAKKKGARAETWFFDDSTTLLSRIDLMLDGGPQGEVPVTILFSDYRKTNGVMIPCVITTKAGLTPNVSILRIDSIEHNFQVDDAIFQPSF